MARLLVTFLIVVSVLEIGAGPTGSESKPLKISPAISSESEDVRLSPGEGLHEVSVFRYAPAKENCVKPELYYDGCSWCVCTGSSQDECDLEECGESAYLLDYKGGEGENAVNDGDDNRLIANGQNDEVEPEKKRSLVKRSLLRKRTVA